MESLLIRSGQGDYSVEFHDEIASIVERLVEHRNAVLLVDRKVAALYPQELAPALDLPTLLVDATEEEKSLAGATRVLTFLQQNDCVRDTTVVAIGGGITQDIAAFCSRMYYRGIPWVYVPTTLLAMSDSCIGAKCAVNFGEYKNQLGFFYAPFVVHVCPSFLRTLPDQDV